MRNSSTCCTHSKPKADEKLEFVEHVLGVLIESRFGYGNPYTRLGESPVTTGHSQMFANITLLTEAEIEAHLRMADPDQVPFYLGRSLERRRENHLRQRVVVYGCELLVIESDERSSVSPNGLLATSKPPAQAGGSPLARGSPTFLGRTINAGSPAATFPGTCKSEHLR